MVTACTQQAFSSKNEKINKDDLFELSLSHQSKALVKQPSFKLDPVTALCLAQQHYPRTFSDFDRVNWKAIQSYRTQIMALRDRRDSNAFSTHSPSLIPLVEQFEKFIEPFAQSGKLTVQNRTLDLLDEIAFHMTPKRSTGHGDVNSYWFLDIHARFLTAFGSPSEAEKAVALHAVYPGILLGVFQNKAHHTPYKPMLIIDDFDNMGREDTVSYATQFVTPKVVDFIELELSKYLPPESLYPMYGRGKVGIPFLVLTALDRIFPHAYTTNREGYHGLRVEETSRSGITAHDSVHAYIGDRLPRLQQHIALKVKDSFKATQKFNYDPEHPEKAHFSYPVSAKEIATEYTPLAVKKYQQLHGVMRAFHNNFLLGKVLPQRGLKAYKEIMGGFFWFMRETPHFPHYLYKKHSFETMMELMIQGASNRVKDSESWESPKDPLATDPLTGLPFSTGLPEEFDGTSENFLLTQLIEGENMLQAFGSNIDLVETKVTYHPKVQEDEKAQIRFIDADIHFMNGHIERRSFTTLFHKWLNIDDSVSILRWSGSNIQKPNLADFEQEDRRGVAIAFIDKVQKELIDRLRLFQAVFKFYVRYENGRDPSIDQTFFKSSFKDQQRFEKWIKDKSSSQ